MLFAPHAAQTWNADQPSVRAEAESNRDLDGPDL
jgi:hypothetical protein